jgi:predicted nucleic acid-binding protein
MGVILDSSILITAERQGNNAWQMLSAVSSHLGNTEIALSVLTLLELAHGAARADTSERKANREHLFRN